MFKAESNQSKWETEQLEMSGQSLFHIIAK